MAHGQTEAEELAEVLDAEAVRSVFQPIVDLRSGEVLGFEALARGPVGSPLATPIALFRAAHDAGRTLELERLCRTAALRGALEVLPDDVAVFVNVEPSTLVEPDPPALAELTAAVVERRRLVVELTERTLADAPAEVLRAVDRFRALGCAVALDDVGADPRSVALLPYVRPEVIKLDLRLVQDRPTLALATTVHAVSAAAERSGARLLAEGVETPGQRRTAESLGARYGQGWHFGRPAAEPDVRPQVAASSPSVARRSAPAAPRPDAVDPTPFDVVAAHIEPRVATKRLLYSISRYLEHHLAATSESSVLLSTFQVEDHFTPRTQQRYAELAARASFVAVYAEGIPDEPASGVRGTRLAPDDALCDEWDVCVVTPHVAAAFVARDLGDEGRDEWLRRFAFCLTYDRELAVAASGALMRRLAAQGPVPDGGVPSTP